MGAHSFAGQLITNKVQVYVQVLIFDACKETTRWFTWPGYLNRVIFSWYVVESIEIKNKTN